MCRYVSGLLANYEHDTAIVAPANNNPIVVQDQQKELSLPVRFALCVIISCEIVRRRCGSKSLCNNALTTNQHPQHHKHFFLHNAAY